jgi:hypothetical protein
MPPQWIYDATLLATTSLSMLLLYAVVKIQKYSSASEVNFQF